MDLPYKGIPSPKAAWYKDEKPIVDTPRTRIHYTPQSVGLHIPDTIRDDTGLYRVHLSSDLGEDKAQFRVAVMGKNQNIIYAVLCDYIHLLDMTLKRSCRGFVFP